ncbi:MAG TPA: peptidoglycan-binding domain-containing protein, partial [Nitrosomonas sp.]|nr:peptidoglycan-binding domain-containing protein [Nitrosomonas sp.]
MKSRKIRILSTGVILLCTVGLLSGCGDEAEESVTESKEVITDEPIQSVETIIEPEPIMSLDEMDSIDTLDGMGSEEAGSMEGILDELSDSANDAIDAAEEVTTETTDIMKDYVDENVADAQDAMGDLQEDVSTAVDTTIVEPVADAFEDAEEVVTATPDLTRRVQQALVNAGYNPGPVDGISGPRTLQAIKKFQQENNLAAGELTKETLRA